MNGRILIDLDNVVDVGRGSDETLGQVMQALGDLADEINSALPVYECTLVHLDTRDYLAFVPIGDLDSVGRTIEQLFNAVTEANDPAQRARWAFEQMEQEAALEELIDAHLAQKERPEIHHYFSTVRGITEQRTGGEVVYYGAVLFIPRDEFTTPAHAVKERQLLEKLPNIADVEGTEPVPDGIIERYEVYDAHDAHNGVWVMYRVPYQAKEVNT